MIKNMLIIISLLFVFSCSSPDENIKIISRFGFTFEKIKNKKAVVLPFVLYDGADKGLFNSVYSASYKKYIKDMRFSSPEVAEVMLSNGGVSALFSEIAQESILSNQTKWAKVGKKIGADYLIVFSFDKPNHVRDKGSYRQLSNDSTGRDNDVPTMKKVFTDINIWYLKGSVTVIDVLKAKAVYMLAKETKSGYSRRGASNTGAPSTFRDFFSGLNDEQIPTLKNAIKLFFKGVFNKWS
jgi:hypothetical protein